ncbi:MAG: glutamine--fructose-6-phosphate transaminase (isomerizing) [Gammaproteobacteria bacterium]|nr:glutamine--fructose-6-phosphate transaminase (isomerizing) [Gammaproteobacteria bacterium]
MCGIIGVLAQRNVVPLLIDGLRRLEYRGYDSAGIAVSAAGGELRRERVVGKVECLAARLGVSPIDGHTGIAHTRWATHGRPTASNAHPHACGPIAVVHNGIIENHAQLRDRQRELGYEFESETDTEVIVHEIHRHMQSGLDLLGAVRATVADLRGAYALAVIDANAPERLIGVRCGSPLVIGIGTGEAYLASDLFALMGLAGKFIVLEEGDVADVRREQVAIYDHDGKPVDRGSMTPQLSAETVDRGGYRHYMLKEIHDQPAAIQATLHGWLGESGINGAVLGERAVSLLQRVRNVHFVGCGTSFHAGLLGRYWVELLAGVPCAVEVASEFRHRTLVVPPDTLLVAISQSGETADTLGALRLARNYLGTLAICNVPDSALTRAADCTLHTRAGREIGVASTKAYITQLTALLLLALLMGRQRGLDPAVQAELVGQLAALPSRIEQVLALNARFESLAAGFAQKHHALFLGRGSMLPVAMEGALKLKEISYIHAEAYPAGELKHGPLALVDEDMPVVAVAPNNILLDKLLSNLHEVRARGGELFVFADQDCNLRTAPGMRVIQLPRSHDVLAPIVYTVPLQLLAYHVAVLKGADVDQPRNLAKSVTVE